MEFFLWYAVALGGAGVVFTLRHLHLTSTNYYMLSLAFQLRRPRILGEISILYVLILMTFLAINALILYLGDDLSRMSAQLAALNLVPIFVGGRTNIVLDK
ncbi:hypothetical protein JX265_014142, partial [Neoarthrinium moseri]